MDYNFSLLEDFIYKVYARIEVSDASQIDLFAIAQALDVSVFLHPYPTQAIVNDGRHYVFINDSTPQEEWWEVFGHELGHILLHAGNQGRLPLPFVEYQEWQADLFALHFCIPTFMLLSDDLPNDCRLATADVAEHYGVSLPFAYERLKIHKQKLFDQKFHIKLWETVH